VAQSLNARRRRWMASSGEIRGARRAPRQMMGSLQKSVLLFSRFLHEAKASAQGGGGGCRKKPALLPLPFPVADMWPPSTTPRYPPTRQRCVRLAIRRRSRQSWMHSRPSWRCQQRPRFWPVVDTLPSKMSKIEAPRSFMSHIALRRPQHCLTDR
jgi:hypothetical protein